MKCFKLILFQRKLEKLMKRENILVRKYCMEQDWPTVAKWLHRNKASFKAFKRLQKIKTKQ